MLSVDLCLKSYNFIYVKVTLELYLTKGTKSNKLFDSKRFDFCATMKGSSKINRFLRAIIEALRDQVPALFHKCPYIGIQDFPNFTLPSKLMSLFPLGVYNVKVGINSTDKAKVNLKVLFDMELS